MDNKTTQREETCKAAMSFVRYMATYAPKSEARDIARRIWDNSLNA